MMLKEICNEIWKMEEKYNLLDSKIQNVYFWEIIRNDTVSRIMSNKIELGERHKYKNSIKKKINMIISIVFNNPFLFKKKCEFIVLDHPRKYYIEDKYIDIYTEYILEKIGSRSLILEEIYGESHISEKAYNRMYNDCIIVIARLIKIFKSVKFTDEENKLINKLNKEIIKIFNINLDLKSTVKEAILNHITEVEVYERLFKKIKPKAIFLVVGYGKKPACDAAKKLGIKVIELQHGVIDKYHMGYSYPNRFTSINYFPDYILTYGEYWVRNYIPIKQDHIINYGFEHFNRRKNALVDIKKDKKQVFFISQGTIGRQMTEIFYDVAKTMKNYKFIYKLHPGEYYGWKEQYPMLLKAKQLNNVSVIDNSDEDLYISLKKSEFVVGVYSTAIYEALGMECKVILINISGIEYMEELLQNNKVKVANNYNEIVSLIYDNKLTSNENYGAFFNPNIDFRKVENILGKTN